MSGWFCGVSCFGAGKVGGFLVLGLADGGVRLCWQGLFWCSGGKQVPFDARANATKMKIGSTA
jgi:hypothetical protein